MEENKSHDKGCCVGPICYHGEHGHGKHILLRWVLGIVILLITFWMGVKIGELKAMVGGYGYGMHGGYYRSMPMMQGFYGQDQESPYQFWMR